MVRVKVCGITNEQDADMAVRLGVHALWFIFASGPRLVTPEQARRIISAIPPFVQRVGVFVNHERDEISDIASFCGLDIIQFHGEESPDECAFFMPRAVKVFPVSEKFELERIEPYLGKVMGIMFDTYSERRTGGTGRVFDWHVAGEAKKLGLPVTLAGGLTPGNIFRAISTARPYAVDVNSGVEKSPGRKDSVLLQEFMNQVKEAEMHGV